MTIFVLVKLNNNRTEGPAPLRNAAGLCIFVPTDRFLYATIGCRPVNRPDWGGFFVPSRIWPFLGDLRGFCGPGGTSYHPGRKSVLNRRNAKNNLFCTKV